MYFSIMLLKILPVSTHCPIPNPFLHFKVSVTAAFHFWFQNLFSIAAVTNYHKHIS